MRRHAELRAAYDRAQRVRRTAVEAVELATFLLLSLAILLGLALAGPTPSP